MKLFNLEQALAGEPVRLRNGRKAYVKYVMPDQYKGNYPLIGYYIEGNSYIQYSWMINGRSRNTYEFRNEDIISMWEEPRPRVQLDLPCPLKVPQEGMWYFTENGKVFKSNYREGFEHLLDQDGFDSGYYFATKEDAEEWINAMKGARR